jgi:GNAT superfamily N-acetyltransferase
VITVSSGGSHPDVVRSILDTIPEWFGLPESNDDYVAKADLLRNVVARDGDEIVGICLLLDHNPQSVEIDLLAVRRERHRHGIGGAILEHVEDELRQRGVLLLHLKTFGPSIQNEPYERTRAFYVAHGFVAMEERVDVWGADNPCLFLVKSIA